MLHQALVPSFSTYLLGVLVYCLWASVSPQLAFRPHSEQYYSKLLSNQMYTYMPTLLDIIPQVKPGKVWIMPGKTRAICLVAKIIVIQDNVQ